MPLATGTLQHRFAAKLKYARTGPRDEMMRKLAFLLLLAGIAPSAFAAKKVTIEQLEQTLAASPSKSDADLAWQLADLQLTERLSSDRLSRLRGEVTGEKSQQALGLLADQSAFLDLPATDLPATPAPDLAEQRRIMGLVVHYVGKTIPQLPNFFATRVTTRFQDTPGGFIKASGLKTSRYEPLHSVGSSSVTVLYRDGREEVDSGATGAKTAPPPELGLNSWGEFGPILSTVLLDAAQNKLAWSHWEKGVSGQMAVFSYSVPREKSHYEVDYCCIADSEQTRNHVFHQLAGYRGEMAVDPASGTILRLKIEAELKPGEPVVRAATLVEYDSVEIGGSKYFCPTRSIALSRAQTASTDNDVIVPSSAGGHMGGFTAVHASSVTAGPEQTLLNKTVFDQYHVFRAESRLLAGGEAGASMGLPPLGSESPSPAGAPAASGDSASPAAGAANAPAIASASSPAPEPPPAPAPAIPEITTEAATGLPDVPAAAQTAAPGESFTIRTTSRLVDIGLVAYDKKGHPLTDLKPEDFEIYDNGRKQELRFFSQAASAPSEPLKASGEPATPFDEAPQVFSNRRATANKASSVATEDSATILLMDGSNMAFGDLTRARGEAIRFIHSLPAGERLGLYTMKSLGFQILAEATTDHALLEAKLHQWMPSAQDLIRAQDEERLNRQQINEVHKQTDLTRVNGHTNIDDPDSGYDTMDPELRDYGRTPGQDALDILVGVARHLAAIPGHKNLAWITSDNVLADWSNKSVSIDKGSKSIEPFALRAQEALNDAHVSIYPLDASQLEGGGIGADMQHRNVELTPAAKDNLTTFASKGASSGAITSPSGEDVSLGREMKPGRTTAAMQQDLHPIQGPIREVAEATGGRAIRRAGDIAGELSGVVADGRAAYLLGFSPDQPADDKYHLLTVKLVNRKDVTLRYRTGFLYSKESLTLKARFKQAVWRPLDVNEIGVDASPIIDAQGSAIHVNVAATDLSISNQGGLWTGKLDIFLVERDDAGLHAKINGLTVGLKLKPATYQKVLHDGLAFDQRIESKLESGSLRVVVIDVNSGRMGSVTIPAAGIAKKR